MSALNRRLLGLGLVIGYVGLLGAIVTAHNAPATGYELSLYAATPVSVWIGLAIAAVVGLTVAFAGGVRDWYRSVALVLAGAAGLSLPAIPVVRGYRFYGAGDSLTHLGWARELAGGSLQATDLLYPGVHSIAVFVSSVAGVPLTRAMLYVVSIGFPLVFLLVVPLVVKLVVDSRWAVPVGLAAALLFVPINNISVHPTAHPASQAILFLPVPIFLALTYTFDRSPGGVATAARDPVDDGTDTADDAVTSRTVTDGGGSPIGITGVGVLLMLVSVAMVLIHPQQALNVALVFVAVTALQILYRRRNPTHRIAGNRWLGLQTGLIALALAIWIPRFERARGTISFTVGSLLGGDTEAGTVVAAKATSLTAIGGSVSELFFKLFLGGAVLSAITGFVLLATATGRLRDGWSDAGVRYLGIALVPLAAVFAVVFVSGSGDMYFRYHGFIMVFVTVLGAVGLVLAADRLTGVGPRGAAPVIVLVLLLALTPVAAMGYHSSPYMYQPSSHVTDSQLHGFAETFEHREESVPFTGLRGGPRRYVDYHYGTEYARTDLSFPGYEAGISDERFEAAQYDRVFNETRYLAVTQSAYERETVLYGGFRYNEAGFQRLETTADVNRVRSSDGLRLYLVQRDDEPAGG